MLGRDSIFETEMSLDCTPELILRLVGPLRLSRRDGGDVTPRTIKAQGLLALLGSAPTLRRSRAWLQDKLWSDRSAENGAASLRQTVHRLRAAVGPDNDWLISEPGWLGLDPARVLVALEPEARDWEATGDPPEFCEGLDIADPEFEDWLRDNRLAFEDQVAERPPPPPAIVQVVAPTAATDGNPAGGRGQGRGQRGRRAGADPFHRGRRGGRPPRRRRRAAGGAVERRAAGGRHPARGHCLPRRRQGDDPGAAERARRAAVEQQPRLPDRARRGARTRRSKASSRKSPRRRPTAWAGAV